MLLRSVARTRIAALLEDQKNANVEQFQHSDSQEGSSAVQ